MKYLIFGMAALLAGECALAQTTAPVTAPSEPAKKDAVTQPAPTTAPGYGFRFARHTPVGGCS